MAEKTPRLLLVAHQSINARWGFSKPDGGGDLSVNGGDPTCYALLGCRLSCSAADAARRGYVLMSNIAMAPLLEIGKLGGGQSLNGVVGYQLPEEDGFSALRAASCGCRDAEWAEMSSGAVYLKQA